MEIQGELENKNELQDTLQRLVSVPECVITEIIDIYNYMVTHKTVNMILGSAEAGIEIQIRINNIENSAGQQA